MAVETQAALAGGVIGGLVVLLGVLLEQKLTRSREHRSRRQALVGSVLGDYIEAIARNTRAAASDDVAQIHASGARITRAHGQLLVYGTPAISEALEHFERSGKNMGTEEGQNSLLHLLETIRMEVLPGEPDFPSAVARRILFEKQ